MGSICRSYHQASISFDHDGGALHLTLGEPDVFKDALAW